MPNRYYTLDAMRGIAALLVAAYHLQQRWNGPTLHGYLAVDLFFALSGFVIALNYADRFANGLKLSRFVELRLIRLYPLYALGLAFGIAKIAAGFVLHIPPAASVGNLACAIAFGAVMLPDLCSPELFPLNGPSWSLFFEVAINGVFALVLWRISTRLLLGWMAISAAFLVFTIAPPDYFNVGWGWDNIFGGAARTVFSFCTGILLFRVMPYGWRRQSYASMLPILGLAAILWFNVPQDYQVLLEFLAVFLIFPALICSGCLLEAPNRTVTRIFGFLGDLSYPMYAIHWPLISIVVPLTKKLHLSTLSSVGLFFGFLVPLAYMAARVDVKLRERISTALKLRRTAVLQSV